MRARYIIGYHKDGQVCFILGNLKFLGGGWGFGTVENEKCPNTVFVLVVVEVPCNVSKDCFCCSSSSNTNIIF